MRAHTAPPMSWDWSLRRSISCMAGGRSRDLCLDVRRLVHAADEGQAEGARADKVGDQQDAVAADGELPVCGGEPGQLFLGPTGGGHKCK